MNINYLLFFGFLLGSIGFLLFQNTFDFSDGFYFILINMSSLWVLSLVLKDSSIVDIFWGPGIVLAGGYYFLKSGNNSIENILLLSALIFWGVRLGGYLALRNIGQPEDARYQQFRAEGGKNYWWISFFRVFLLQGIIMWIISAIFQVAFAAGDNQISLLSIIGLFLFGTGFIFETIGDAQLYLFKKNPSNKGKVLNTGLWKYTRHPNYFGEAVLWWGFFCFALNHVEGLYYIFAPLFMTFLLVRISGVAMLERNLKTTKPQYKDYIKNTPAFFPWWPKG